jgi:hypothetical protein
MTEELDQYMGTAGFSVFIGANRGNLGKAKPNIIMPY